MSRIVVLMATLLVAAHFIDAPAAQSIAPPTRIPSPPRTDAIPGARVTTSEIPREVRRAVVADAARRFRVDTNAVVLADAERVTWPDGALGCPEPGIGYTQARVPGFRVVARTLAGSLLYHTDSQGHVVNCAPDPRG
jgi:hypothetical protein